MPGIDSLFSRSTKSGEFDGLPVDLVYSAFHRGSHPIDVDQRFRIDNLARSSLSPRS